MVFSTEARERRLPWISKLPCSVDIGEAQPPPRARVTTIPRSASHAHGRTTRTLFDAFKMERCGVHAVAKARGRGSVIEHVAEVGKGSSGFVFLADDPGEAQKRGAAQALGGASHATLGMRITASPSFLLAVRLERILSSGGLLGARRGAAPLLPNHEKEPIH